MKLHLVVVSSIVLTLAGCATNQTEHKLDEQARQEPAATVPGGVAMRAEEVFENAPNLTPQQKDRMRDLVGRTMTDNNRLRAELGQYKSLLFKSLVAKDYSAPHVSLLQKKIISLHNRQLGVMTSALAEAQRILGRGLDADSQSRIYRVIVGGAAGDRP